MGVGTRPVETMDARASVATGAGALDRTLEDDAELSVHVLSGEAEVLGAFGRGHDAPVSAPLARRVSGGARVRVGEGTIHLVLALARTDALFHCDPARLNNRYVRPLLRALTKHGAPAAYFGRDWVSVAHRPAAAIGFAHDAGTGRAVFEGFIAVRAPFSGPRRSFLGKTPGTLEELAGRAFDAEALARAIRDAYASVAGGARARPAAAPPEVPSDESLRADPPWVSEVDEVIGAVCAGRDASGVLRLGGDFMASRDAVARVEAGVAALGSTATREAIGLVVNEAFSLGVLEGVRDLGSVRDTLWAATRR